MAENERGSFEKRGTAILLRAGIAVLAFGALFFALFFAGRKMMEELARFVSNEEAILSGFDGAVKGLRAFLAGKAPVRTRNS